MAQSQTRNTNAIGGGDEFWNVSTPATMPTTPSVANSRQPRWPRLPMAAASDRMPCTSAYSPKSNTSLRSVTFGHANASNPKAIAVNPRRITTHPRPWNNSDFGDAMSVKVHPHF